MSADTLLHTDRQTDMTAPHGPFARIVLASLGVGLATALTLSLVVFAGDTEATVTGAMLVGFGVGWMLIDVLSRRLTDRAQRWTAVPCPGALAGCSRRSSPSWPSHPLPRPTRTSASSATITRPPPPAPASAPRTAPGRAGARTPAAPRTA
jgi:hypothetical protein